MIYRIFCILIIVSLGLSCDKKQNFKYSKQQSVSNQEGIPRSDTVFYFPIQLFSLNSQGINSFDIRDEKITKEVTNISLDSFRLKRYSEVLYQMNEPLLYNYYLDNDIYRFTWLRSFHPCVVIRLVKHKKNITIIEKIYYEYYSDKKLNDSIWVFVLDSTKIDSFSRNIDLDNWTEFENNLNRNKYSSMISCKMEYGIDGARWILEKHTRSGYHIVDRWAPDSIRNKNFRYCCDFLLDISRFSEEERY